MIKTYRKTATIKDLILNAELSALGLGINLKMEEL